MTFAQRMANTQRAVDEVERVETVDMKLLISAYALVPFVLTVMLMYAIAMIVRRTSNKGARGGFLTRTAGGDIGIIAGGAAAFYGLSLGMMYIPNLVKPDKTQSS